VATEFRGASTVFAGYVASTVIDHNTIQGTGYTAVSLGWGWGNHVSVQEEVQRVHARLVAGSHCAHCVRTALYPCACTRVPVPVYVCLYPCLHLTVVFAAPLLPRPSWPITGERKADVRQGQSHHREPHF
jgi:hypothetical protein